MVGSDDEDANDPRHRELADADAADLDDELDRVELRQRYYGLLQELRVVLPGVQVLMAFLLTAPFASRFAELDARGRDAYLVALVSSLGSIVCLLAPTVFHRVGERRARAARLVWAIRLQVLGIVLLATALLSASWCVVRLVFGVGGGRRGGDRRGRAARRAVGGAAAHVPRPQPLSQRGVWSPAGAGTAPP